jgi:hemin uptake protein HemP
VTPPPAPDTRDAAVPPAAESSHAVVQSRDLFGTEREIVILHGTEAYRLRITRTDKLILTK